MGEKISVVSNLIEKLAPPSLAASWDSCGLMAGDPMMTARRVLFALDCTMDVAREASEKGCNLIVTHHPLIFKPLKNLSLTNPKNRLITFLIENRIAVYSAHTNFDHAVWGVSHILAERLGITNMRVLRPARDHMTKLIFYVPSAQEEAVCQAVFKAGAGGMGHYGETRFSTSGEGSFLPLTGADPFIGETGVRETVQEVRVETVVPRNRIGPVVAALYSAHPYEEPAFDLVALLNRDRYQGAGIVGNLAQPTDLESFAVLIKQRLQLRNVQCWGEPRKVIERVAVCGGAGKSLIQDALEEEAEVLVTGDLGYHEGLDALEQGMCLIDAGHDGTEWPAMEYLSEMVSQSLDVEVLLSEVRPASFGI